MKQLLNTLFVTSEDIYLSLEGENVLANREKTVIARYPLHTLQSIVTFSYSGASPALMGACAEKGIGLAFCTPRGRFLARVCGEANGNVLLRRVQYRIADEPTACCGIARTMIFGKLSNSAASIQRTLRDHAPRVQDCGLEKAASDIRGLLPQVLTVSDPDSLRGLEGTGATAYFGVFDAMLLNRKEDFFFGDAAAVRRWTGSMPCCPLPTACLLTIVPARWKVWDWIPMWASCTGIARDGSPLRWI